MKNIFLRFTCIFMSAFIVLFSFPQAYAYGDPMIERYLSADYYQFHEGGDAQDFLELTQAWYDYFSTHEDAESFQGYWNDAFDRYISDNLTERHNSRIPHPYLCGYYTHDGTEITIVGVKLLCIDFYFKDTDYPGLNGKTAVCGIYENNEEAIPESLIIPDQIDGVPVTEIADGAFYGLSALIWDAKLKTVVIGDNVRTVGANAFSSNSTIESVRFGKNVQMIGKNAFAQNVYLHTVSDWGEQLETIGEGAFNGAGADTEDGLSFPPFPDTLRSIGKKALYHTYLAHNMLVIPSSVQIIASDACYYTENLERLVLLNRQLVIERTNNNPLLSAYSDETAVYCYAGSTAEADAQQYGYAYALIDGESLVFNGQTVEGDTLQLEHALTAEDFLACAASDGEECEVRLSGLADGKVVNGSTVTLWNTIANAEGKVYTVHVESDFFDFYINNGYYYTYGFADMYSHYDGQKLMEEHYTGDLNAYAEFLIAYFQSELTQFVPEFDEDDPYLDSFLSVEMARAHNGDDIHPYLACRIEDNGEVTITGIKARGLYYESGYFSWRPVFDYSEVPVSEIVIPDEIDGHPVTRIADHAFEYHEYGMGYGYYDNVDVVIGDNVREIGAKAFYDNDRIRSVTFGKNVEEIGDCAFLYCYYVEEIPTWGENLRSIGREAFCGCMQFAEHRTMFPDFPETLETIGEKAFCYTKGFSKVIIPKTVQTMSVDAFICSFNLEALVILNRDLIIDHTEVVDYIDPYRVGVTYCYAGSTTEADAQQYGYAYSLIDGESLVYDGQTVEENVLRIPQSVTAEDFLARASSDGEECEVRLSGLADGKVVNGSTVTLWNNRVDAEGKAYTVRCGDVQVAGDMDNSGIVGLADVTALVRYLAGGWNVTINLNVADVNKDGFVNLKDATLLRRYIAGGWNVVLK